jgi:hypothetical protein
MLSRCLVCETITADKAFSEPHPLERLRPIVAPAILTGSEAAASVAAAVDATSQIPMPPPAPTPAILVQVLFARQPSDAVAFFNPQKPLLSRAPSILSKGFDTLPGQRGSSQTFDAGNRSPCIQHHPDSGASAGTTPQASPLVRQRSGSLG